MSLETPVYRTEKFDKRQIILSETNRRVHMEQKSARKIIGCATSIYSVLSRTK